MNWLIEISLLLTIFYCKQGSVSGQLYPQGCCSTPYYQSPTTCCPQACCVQTAAPVLCCQAQEVMKIRLSLKTLLTWDNDYGDSKSAKYKALVTKVQTALKKLYAKTPSFADARVSQFTKGSTVAIFVLAFKMVDPDPLKPLRDALPSKYIPDASDAGKINIDPDSLTVTDKVIPLNVVVNLDTKPPCKQETESKLAGDILNGINEKRKIHKAKSLRADSNLAKAALTHAQSLGKTNQLKYSANAAKQGEIAVMTTKKAGECLTGKEVVDKWYAEAKTFFDPKIPLSKKATDAKRFMQAMWASTTTAGVGVHKYTKDGNTAFVVVTFLKPKAAEKSLKSSTDVAKNVLKGSYKGNKDELSQDDTENAGVSDDTTEVEAQDDSDNTSDDSSTDPYDVPDEGYDTDDANYDPYTDPDVQQSDDTSSDPNNYSTDDASIDSNSYHTSDDASADPHTNQTSADAGKEPVDADDWDYGDDAMPWD